MQVPGQRPPVQESHAHGAVGLVLLIFGFGVAYLLTPILSGLLGLLTLWVGWKFFKWRVDPMDMFFWMKSKPSWGAVGITWLSGLLLLGVSYFVYAYINHHTFISAYASAHFGL